MKHPNPDVNTILEARQELPMSLRDVPPYEGAQRLVGKRADGLTDCEHTGGAWLYQGLVYKPLDGRYSMNATTLYTTAEEAILTDLAGLPFFPKNWHVEELNGRRFLVRKFAKMAIDHPGVMNKKRALEVADAVRKANAAGWEINDEITVGFVDGQWFIVDLSAAQYFQNAAGMQASDAHDVRRFFEHFGHHAHVRLVQFASEALNNYRIAMMEEHADDSDFVLSEYLKVKWVYASMYRPVDRVWSTNLPEDTVFFPEPQPGDGKPHTWVLAPEPLDESLAKTLELDRVVWPTEYLKRGTEDGERLLDSWRG